MKTPLQSAGRERLLYSRKQISEKYKKNREVKTLSTAAISDPIQNISIHDFRVF